MNIGTRLPFYSSLILTTSEDLQAFNKSNKNLNLLVYSKDDNFNHYILKVIAAYRIEYKKYYSELTLSIDPGTKHIGMVIYLDDYYLNSQTIYNEKDFIALVGDYIDCFQKENPKSFKIIFKFGRGILQMTINLIRKIYQNFERINNLKIYLIDESKSSKIRIQDKTKRIRTKHELSALILSFREGVEVNKSNYFKTVKQIRNRTSNNRENKEDNLVLECDIKELVEKVLNNEISLSESSELIMGYK